MPELRPGVDRVAAEVEVDSVVWLQRSRLWRFDTGVEIVVGGNSIQEVSKCLQPLRAIPAYAVDCNIEPCIVVAEWALS